VVVASIGDHNQTLREFAARFIIVIPAEIANKEVAPRGLAQRSLLDIFSTLLVKFASSRDESAKLIRKASSPFPFSYNRLRTADCAVRTPAFMPPLASEIAPHARWRSSAGLVPPSGGRHLSL